MSSLNSCFGPVHRSACRHGAGIHESLQLILDDKHAAEIECQPKHAKHHCQPQGKYYQAEATLPLSAVTRLAQHCPRLHRRVCTRSFHRFTLQSSLLADSSAVRNELTNLWCLRHNRTII